MKFSIGEETNRSSGRKNFDKILFFSEFTQELKENFPDPEIKL